ncbi:MAG: AAA family ATPase [Chloroflexi bacterium]|nr:AAA family ATPase [Chloroflexota bacterium]
MNCPSCQTANPESAKFCLNCGAALAAACSNCGTQLAPGAKFCHNCGQPLTPPPSPVGVARQERGEGLGVGGEARNVEGERRIVTVLFCDVKGSTAMAEKLDPEEWAEIMNGAFERLISPVYRYEGTVARLMGDAILAFFGAPIAHEDDPQRAVLAGLDIVEGIQPYREQIKRERGLDFNVRVGINTGLVVVGEVGSDLRVEYTVMGDAVNLAARMEQTAQPGTVQISGHTHKLIAPLFEFESLGGIEVKGKAEPVPAYQVIKPKASPGRLRGIEGLNAPLIGRDKELQALGRVVDEVRQGRGRIVCLVGEAGLGKSRLLSETRALWEAAVRSTGQPAYWNESRGVSYDTTRPYGQFQQILRQSVGALESDPPDAIHEKIARTLEALSAPPEQIQRTRRVLEVMLAVERGADRLPAEGEQLKRELFQVMLNAWRSWAADAPITFVFDDLHWADPASVELLQHLFQLVAEAPILFLCAFRPDHQAHSWPVKQKAETDYAPYYTEIALSPLSTEDSGLLVNSLLAISDLPPKLRESILQKSEGNPFFVEEVVRMLIDSGAVVRDADAAGRLHWRAATDVDALRLSIPGNLQALLLARIDRLEEETRRTLQLAAVIGRSFYYRVLKLISEAADELDKQLGALQKAELIREAASQPEIEYIFRHALTQEAAYSSILLKRRREFHRRVGETLEQLFGDRLEEYASLLAHHFYEAGDGRAQKYYTLAGEAAARLYANAEAAAHYTRALEVAKRGEASTEQLSRLYLSRGGALELNTMYVEALADYDEMEKVAAERNDRQMVFAALMARAKLLATPNPVQNPELARTVLEQALVLARDLNDRAAECRVLWNLMLVIVWGGGDQEQAAAYGEGSLALARELNMREQLAFTLNDLTYPYLALGQRGRAHELVTEAISLWRELGTRPMLADSLSLSIHFYILSGHYDQAVAAADEAMSISRAIDNQWGQASSRVYISYVYLDRGETDQAMQIMQEAMRLGEQTGLLFASIIPATDLAWVHASLGAVEQGLALARRAQALEEKVQLPFLRAYPFVALARLRLTQGDLAAAEAALRDLKSKLPKEGMRWFIPMFMPLIEGELALAHHDSQRALTLMNEQIDYLKRTETHFFASDALHLKAKALLALGLADEAWEALVQARTAAEQVGSRRSLWPILLDLSRLEAGRGHAAEAQALRRQAREVVEFIAGNISDSELRVSFLNLVGVYE